MTPLKVISSEQITEESISKYIPRNVIQLDEIKNSVLNIIENVKKNGDNAIVEFSKKFDKVELKRSEIQVTLEEIKDAYENIDIKLLNALKYAKKNLLKFHQAQIREDWSIEIEKGVIAGQIYRPLESVGVYVPGGKAIYPSSVLMAAIPAFIAGVKDIILCSPPQTDKRIAPEIIVAAKEVGIKKMFKVGGAQAVAAMAFGTQTVPSVQKVVGPGSKWVNAAKQLLSNVVAIDTPAGPSEILIIADNSVNFKFVIVDFISQIEHDSDNIGIIVSDSSELIEKVMSNIDSYIANSKRKEIINAALNNSLIIKAKTIEECIKISNLIAPEHVEIMTKNPHDVLKHVNNAGAVFLGQFSPVSLGDYSAGTNHVLPTGGNAKKYSGLNVFDFLKIINILDCDENGLKALSDSSTTIAEHEGLLAHKEAIEERLKYKN